ncbi:MAG: DUF2723 domain-containing protein [Verrucomicrobiota bacterium]
MQVALAALLLYVLTLSHGITLASLPLAAKVAGWDWQPMVGQPLLWLLTLPLRALPAGWLPPALNLFSAVCAALTLGILARSLELADWDRPLSALKPWPARLPILLACLLCGLEFNFWQEATAATGEMLQLLLFAVVVWCLLEYRVAREFRWLPAATFVWGLGMAENWMMVLTLPLFAGLLLWFGLLPVFPRETPVIKGEFSILKREQVLRLVLAGLAGFSLFAVLPLVNGLSPHSPWSFGEAWIQTLKNLKLLFSSLYGEFWRGHRMVFLAVVMFFLVPVLPAIVRLRDEGLQNKSGLDQFQTWIYRGLLAGLLLACLWLAFDPLVGARQIVFKQMNLSLPLLSLDYLVALGGGFLAGNLLLALLAVPKAANRLPGFDQKYLRPAAVPVFIGLLLCVSLGLVYRNAPAVALANRQPLAQFGELALRSLPPDGGIVFSDEPQRLLAFQAAAAARGTGREWLAVDTHSLPKLAYRRWLADRHAGDWRTGSGGSELNPVAMMQLVGALARTNRVFYLHPSSGYFFDFYYLQAVGSVYEFAGFTDKSISPPPLTAEAIARAEKFWDAAAPRIEAVRRVGSSKPPALAPLPAKIYSTLHLQPVVSWQSRLLRDWYSVALNDWGVQLQRTGRLPAARQRFEQALALNEYNSAARINLQCNTNLSAGVRLNLAAVDVLAGQLGSFQLLSRFYALYGPVDEPSFCYLFGNAFQKVGLPRQALQQFTRAADLASDIPAPKIALAELYSRCGMEAEARQTIGRVRSELSSLPGKNNLDVGLSLLEANSWLAQTNPANASGVLQSVLKEHPGDPRISEIVLRAYLAFGDYSNALQIVSRRVANDPTDVAGMVNQAGLYLRLGDFTNSLSILDRALALSDVPAVRVARAMARTEAGQYSAAEADCLELQKSGTNNLAAYCGLAEIARRKHDNSLAIGYLERGLAGLAPEDLQREQISARIQALKSAPSSAGK